LLFIQIFNLLIYGMAKISPILQTGLSCATFPLLLAIGALPCLTKTLVELGEMSEEVFRGDRLPVLSFPEAQEGEEA
jgi:hypothetical protein